MADNLTTQNLPVSPPVSPPTGHAPAANAGAPARAFPVPALAYSTPGVRTRPGLLTAIGVMSIVIAGLSGVASLMTGLQALGFYFMAVAAAMPNSPAPAAAPTALATTGPATAPTTAPAPASAGPALTPLEVQTVLQKVQAATSNGLNPAQVAALQAALQDPAQELVSPGTAWSPVVSANVSGGNAFVQLSGGWIQLDAQGQVVSQFSTVNPLSRFRISVASVVLVGVEATVSLLLAVLLLVAGILVFRGSPSALRLHRIYAWLKIPTAVAGGVGIGWLFGSFIGAFSPGAGRGNAVELTVFWTWTLGAAALGCAYPIGLLFALRSRQVRAYYTSVGGVTSGDHG